MPSHPPYDDDQYLPPQRLRNTEAEPRLNRLREQRDPDIRVNHAIEGDKEFTLSTGTVLGIFLALALSWAVFFGFGYSMGRKSLQPAVATTDSGDSSGQFGNFKPTAGSTTSSSIANAPSPSSSTPSVPVNAPPPSASASRTQDEEDTPPAHTTPAPVERVAPPPVATPAPQPIASTSTGSYMVQIAAVSHQEDADVLISALQRRGYKVVAKRADADSLIHVQVGPFSNKKDAETMKSRLLGDGYLAILK